MPRAQLEEGVFDLAGRQRATIRRMADGGPFRRILPGSRTIPVGIMTSRKVGRPMYYEGRTEREAIMICEADPAVVTYMAQPHLLKLHIDGGTLDYYPDIEAVLASGKRRVIECKNFRDRRMREPGYVAKLDAARILYLSLGWEFAVLQAQKLNEAHAKLYKQVWGHRFVDLPASLLLDAARIIATERPTRAELIHILGGGPIGEARLDALVVARRCTWDGFPKRSCVARCRPVAADEETVAWG